MDDALRWHYDIKIGKTIKSLEKNGFQTFYAKTKETAAKEILDIIPPNALVGVGGSITIRELGIIEALSKRGNKVADHWQSGLSPEELIMIRRQQLTSDVFLTSSNAVTEDGKLINVDGVGNRVAAMIFGPKKVIVVAAINKIVKDLDAAINRVNNVASPMNAKRLNCKTPCIITGYCTDCESPDRICSVTTIISRKPSLTDFTIMLVGEELGY